MMSEGRARRLKGLRPLPHREKRQQFLTGRRLRPLQGRGAGLKAFRPDTIRADDLMPVEKQMQIDNRSRRGVADVGPAMRCSAGASPSRVPHNSASSSPASNSRCCGETSMSRCGGPGTSPPARSAPAREAAARPPAPTARSSGSGESPVAGQHQIARAKILDPAAAGRGHDHRAGDETGGDHRLDNAEGDGRDHLPPPSRKRIVPFSRLPGS